MSDLHGAIVATIDRVRQQIGVRHVRMDAGNAVLEFVVLAAFLMVPLIYIRQPEYWGIEVVAWQTGIGLPRTALYQVSLDISHLLGTEGIEVIGATTRKKIKVP